MQTPGTSDGDTQKSRWAIAVGLILFCWIVYLLQRMLIPFAVAGLLSYVFAPLVTWLENGLRTPRFVIVTGIYLLILAPLSFLGYWFGPSVAGQTQHLVSELPNMIDAFVHRAFGGNEIELLGMKLHAGTLSNEVMKRVGMVFGSPDGVVRLGEFALETAIGLILTLVLLFYFLTSDKSLTGMFASFAPAGKRARLSYFSHQIDFVVGKYLRGLLLIVIFQCFTTWVGLELLFHLPGSIPLALVIGILEPIPGIGPILAFLVAGGMTIVLGGFWEMAKVLGFIGVLRIAVDNVIGPIILGWAVTLHPVLIIFSLLAGVTLFGFLGLLIAIPVAASVKVLIDEWENAPL